MTPEESKSMENLYDVFADWYHDDGSYDNFYLSKAFAAMTEYASLVSKEKDKEIEKLKTVMIAAAEEIQEHWDAHCDKDGYGPANLMRRLEKGIPAQYGYTAGKFEAYQKQIADLEAKLAQAIEFQKRAFSYGANGCSWEQFFTAQEKEAQESEKGGL